MKMHDTFICDMNKLVLIFTPLLTIMIFQKCSKNVGKNIPKTAFLRHGFS